MANMSKLTVRPRDIEPITVNVTMGKTFLVRLKLGLLLIKAGVWVSGCVKVNVQE